MREWPPGPVPSTCDLFSVTFLNLHIDMHGYISTSGTEGDKNNPTSVNPNTRSTQSTPTPPYLSRKEQREKRESAVPLYLVTTAALTLRGSWKLTVSDVLLVTMRQALAGTSGGPSTRGKSSVC